MFDYEEEPHEFHQIGKFFTHFHSDMEGVTNALIAGGYRVCKTLDGDMIIMSPYDYDDDDSEINFHPEDNDDDGDDNIRNFPRNY